MYCSINDAWGDINTINENNVDNQQEKKPVIEEFTSEPCYNNEINYDNIINNIINNENHLNKIKNAIFKDNILYKFFNNFDQNKLIIVFLIILILLYSINLLKNL